MIPLLALHAAITVSSPLVLAIGVNQGGDVSTQALRYADDDAAEAVLLFDAAGERSWLLSALDAESQARYPQLAARAHPPTLEELRRAVREIARRVEQERASGEQPQVLIWMSGHALRDDEGQTVFPLQQGRLSAEGLIRELIAPLQAAHRVHLLLDSCFAASLVRARAAVERISAATAEQGFFARGIAAYPNVGALVGAGAGERGYEWQEVRSGVFSAMARAGLRGAADVDGDQRVDYQELAAFLAAAAERVSVPEARPSVQVWPPSMESTAALSRREWLGSVAILDADLSSLGTVHVLDERGNWLLAGSFEAGFRPLLWLPGDRQLYLRARGSEQALIERDGTLQLGPAVDTQAQPRSLIGQSLRQGLFQTPYGPAFYSGFVAGAAQPSSLAGPGHDATPWASLGVLGGAGCLLVGTVVLGALAADAGIRYSSTDLERPAREAYDQTLLFGGLGAATLLGTAGLATAAYLLWPDDP
ncbi:MAG: hypothetical protein ABIJ09_24355 [Pseudomonadota bacterium]